MVVGGDAAPLRGFLSSRAFPRRKQQNGWHGRHQDQKLPPPTLVGARKGLDGLKKKKRK